MDSITVVHISKKNIPIRKLVVETNYDALRSDIPKSFDPTSESNSFLLNPQKYLEFK